MLPEPFPTNGLFQSHVGYIISGMKKTSEAQIGDTLFHSNAPQEPLPGFQLAKPMVFAGIFPIDPSQLDELVDSVNKLMLSDSSVFAERESSLALGGGYRCGFLGLLHMEVWLQRLKNEYDMDVISTAPTVSYHLTLTSGEKIVVNNPEDFPETEIIARCEEPWVRSTIIFPSEYLGALLQLCHERRGEQLNSGPLDASRMMLVYRFPLNEIITDFFDRLKQLSSGYATFEYQEDIYEEADIVKVDILLNQVPVEPLAFLVNAAKADRVSRTLVKKLKETLPQQLFVVAIQAAIGKKVLARETLRALRKDVTAKLYGGDHTRRQKLLERQKKGKKEMRSFGKIHLSSDVFYKVLKK
mmetsp:Transcript_3847/g.5775  ORF Transcript_3847/g.5775 Transcript_3847/m.5775 type:complete len:356 (-) Transcript_3847:9-1076(-)